MTPPSKSSQAIDSSALFMGVHKQLSGDRLTSHVPGAGELSKESLSQGVCQQSGSHIGHRARKGCANSPAT